MICVATTAEVREYWERHIHDLDITTHPVGSRGFFDDLDRYHFEKLHHLFRLVPFDGPRGRTVLEVGCGAGVDLARFAKGGAEVTGVDLAASAIALARANFEQQGLHGRFEVADGEQLPFEAVFQVYNRVSWLNALSKLMNVGLEHDDAPVLLKFSIGEFRRLLSGFREVRIVPERFPVKSRLHGGWKGAVYNGLFVGTFNALPRSLVRRFGWHLLAFCRK